MMRKIEAKILVPDISLSTLLYGPLCRGFAAKSLVVWTRASSPSRSGLSEKTPTFHRPGLQREPTAGSCSAVWLMFPLFTYVVRRFGRRTNLRRYQCPTPRQSRDDFQRLGSRNLPETVCQRIVSAQETRDFVRLVMDANT